MFGDDYFTSKQLCYTSPFATIKEKGHFDVSVLLLSHIIFNYYGHLTPPEGSSLIL